MPDFYLDLNDDFVMENLLSGAYTGMPQTRNIQSLYPLTAVIGSLYKLNAEINWHGIFLMACQFGCLLLVIFRLYRLLKKRSLQAAAGGAAAALLFAVGLLCRHYVFYQYSVTVGIMAATAQVFFLTQEKEKGDHPYRDMARRLALPVILLWLGFLLRSEMLLFMLPVTGLSFLYGRIGLYNEDRDAAKTVREKKSLFVKTVIYPCILTGGIILAGAGILSAADSAAYSDPQWKEFRSLFDARTQLYDYEARPAYEGNEAFYDSIGLVPEEVILFENYNFGIDEKIDAAVMQKVADYAKEQSSGQGMFSVRIRKALWDYRHTFVSSSEYPYNLIVVTLYLLCLLKAVSLVLSGRRAKEEESGADQAERSGSPAARAALIPAELFMVFLFRTGLWMYLLYNNRPVTRLTHCLYLQEAIVLAAILAGGRLAGKDKAGSGEAGEVGEGGEAGRVRKVPGMVSAAVMTAVLLAACVSQKTWTDNELKRREAINRPFDELIGYCLEHEDTFVLVDVMSTVDFSEKIFDNRRQDRLKAVNWNFLGGWVSKSPLEREKLARYGIDSMCSALADGSGSCVFAARSDYDTQWLAAYYKSIGKDVTISEKDTPGDGYFTVYRVDPSDAGSGVAPRE